MKCEHCGYDDMGTGDTAHMCPRFNRPVTVLAPAVLGIDKDKRIAELEQAVRNKEYAGKMKDDYIAELKKDAKRYLAMKFNDFTAEYCEHIDDILNDRRPQDLDAIIDAQLTAAPAPTPQPVAQEPVAWRLRTGHGTGWREAPPEGELAHMWTPLYAAQSAPVAAQEPAPGAQVYEPGCYTPRPAPGARNAALEEAAKIADAESVEIRDFDEGVGMAACSQIGMKIRDLKAAPVEQGERKPDLLPPLNIRSDRDMLNYLTQAFESEMSVCKCCGESESTSHMDSAKFLREYLAIAK